MGIVRAITGTLFPSELILGGNVNNGAICGVFCFNVNNLPSNSNWNNGASQLIAIAMSKFSKMPELFLAWYGKNSLTKARTSSKIAKAREAIREEI